MSEITFCKAGLFDGPLLTELTLRSKSFWKYSAEFLEKCRPHLTIDEGYIQNWPVVVLKKDATAKQNKIIGYYSLKIIGCEQRLDNLWLDLPFIGQGFGGLAIAHAKEEAKQIGWDHFYLAMNQDSRSAVRAYYELGWEKDRLTTGKGHAAAIEGDIEKTRTLQLLNRYLPKNKATIVDVGGGAGAYSFYLAGLGHDVHLIDLMPLHIEQARAQQENPRSPRLASSEVGDACKLPFPDHFADVVLCMGPLYHLPNEEERMQCLKEAYRILKKGGLLFAVGISRFVSLLDFLRIGGFDNVAISAMIKRDLVSGKHENPSGNPMLFTTAYFHNPDELQREVKDAGFIDVKMMAIEGPLLFTKDLEGHWKDPASKELLLSFAQQVEQERAILGMSNHLAVIGYRH